MHGMESNYVRDPTFVTGQLNTGKQVNACTQMFNIDTACMQQ